MLRKLKILKEMALKRKLPVSNGSLFSYAILTIDKQESSSNDDERPTTTSALTGTFILMRFQVATGILVWILEMGTPITLLIHLFSE